MRHIIIESLNRYAGIQLTYIRRSLDSGAHKLVAGTLIATAIGLWLFPDLSYVIQQSLWFQMRAFAFSNRKGLATASHIKYVTQVHIVRRNQWNYGKGDKH